MTWRTPSAKRPAARLTYVIRNTRPVPQPASLPPLLLNRLFPTLKTRPAARLTYLTRKTRPVPQPTSLPLVLLNRLFPTLKTRPAARLTYLLNSQDLTSAPTSLPSSRSTKPTVSHSASLDKTTSITTRCIFQFLFSIFIFAKLTN